MTREERCWDDGAEGVTDFVTGAAALVVADVLDILAAVPGGNQSRGGMLELIEQSLIVTRIAGTHEKGLAGRA